MTTHPHPCSHGCHIAEEAEEDDGTAHNQPTASLHRSGAMGTAHVGWMQRAMAAVWWEEEGPW